MESRQSGIVENGRARALSAARDEVEREVEAEYAKKLEEAGPWRRLLLRWEMRREIDRRLRRIAPHDALYLRDRFPGR